MEKKPLYRSIRESFSRDIYMPVCGVVAAPVVMLELCCKEELEKLTSEKPPQSIILHINGALQVIGREGERIADLKEILLLCSRSVPVLYFDSADAGEALAAFTDYHNLGDAQLCVPFNKRHILAEAYKKMPLLRGILDVRGENAMIPELAGIAVSNGATTVILSSDQADEQIINALQKRFIHVITTDEMGFEKAAVEGSNGILTRDLNAAYSFLECFPEQSVFRKKNLYAHKGFSDEGRYSENTITSVVAAAKNYFDGAEIDVKLTGDDVPVVMHNVTTEGLFDCEVLVTEETDYRELASLRRIGFPKENIDRFDDLMRAMKEYNETPVIIEFKPSEKYWNLEEMIRLVDPILHSEFSQQNCVCIMGDLEPGHEYVHKKLPNLPLAYCDWYGAMPPLPQNRIEAEDFLYYIVKVTKGCAAGYNGEETAMNRLLNEYAKFRMITLFPWSRSWTMEPSKWEENGPENCKTYLSGYDAWTTDHGEKFLHLPIKIVPIVSDSGMDERYEMKSPFQPMCQKMYRDGRIEEGACDVLLLSGDLTKVSEGQYAGNGLVKVMLSLKIDLYFGEYYRIYSEPLELYLK